MKFGKVGLADLSERRRARDAVAPVDEEAADLADRLELRHVPLEEDPIDRQVRLT
jgi:hypothetical protein